MAHLEGLHLRFLCVVLQDKVLESLEVQRCGDTSDIIEPHAHDSVVQYIKKTVFLVLFEVTEPHLVILFRLFSYVGVYLLSVCYHSSGDRASE